MTDWQVLRDFPLLRGCAGDDLRRLATCCATVSYPRCREVYREGTPARNVSLVLKGEVVLQKDVAETQRTVRLYVATAGEAFGIGEMMLDRYYTTAIAAADTVLVEVRKEDFVREFLGIPLIRDRVLLDLSQIIRIQIDRMVERSGLHDLAMYLWSLARDCGAPAAGGRIRIGRKVRQPEVASLLNLSREHVTRLFRKLKLQGVVTFNNGHPIVDEAWLDASVRDKSLAASIRYRSDPF